MTNEKEKSVSELLLPSREFFQCKIEEAIDIRQIKMDQVIKSYLVDLLEHYLDIRNLYQEEDEKGRKKVTTLAETFLLALNQERNIKIGQLKKLGDRALYISGFFGDSLRRKIIDLDYYVDMGGAAYGALSRSVEEESFSEVYREFSERFVDFMDVLAYISQETQIQDNKSLIHLYDRYLRTGSELAKDKLVELGLLNSSVEQKKINQQ